MMNPQINLQQMPGQPIYGQLSSTGLVNPGMHFQGQPGFGGQIEQLGDLNRSGQEKKSKKVEKSKWDERRTSDRHKEIRKAVEKELEQDNARNKKVSGHNGEMELERVREEEEEKNSGSESNSENQNSQSDE